MRAVVAALLAAAVAGCGGTPSAPSQPTTIQVRGVITDTVTGGSVGTFTTEVASLPALVEVAASGYLTRTARITSATPTVDLISTAGPFDLGFYRQLVRGALEGNNYGVQVLTAAPRIYLQTGGLSASNIAALEQAARAALPAFTGNRFQVSTWDTGAENRPDQDGWIIVEIINNADPCGRARVGLPAGRIWLNAAAKCAFQGNAVHPMVFVHELGHSLGFEHVDRAGAVMKTGFEATEVTAAERYHAAIAYTRPRGNRDIDVDLLTPPLAASPSPAHTSLSNVR